MRSANKITLGAFVVVSMVLIIGGFLLVGVAQFFTPHFEGMTVVNTSVEGLTPGSPVKYMGMPVGRISRIAMRNTDGYIDIYFDLYGSGVDYINSGTPTSSSPGELLDVLQKEKLSCMLNASGLMGGTYLELVGFGNPVDGELALPNLLVRPDGNCIYIPSRASHVSNAIQNIGKTLDVLSRIDFLALQEKINVSLEKVNDLLDENDLGKINARLDRLLANLEETSAALKDAVTPGNIKSFVSAVSYLEESLRDWRTALPGDRLQRWSDNMTDLLDETRDLAVDARGLIARGAESLESLSENAVAIRNRLGASLTRLDNSLRELMRMISHLEDDPAQLIRGRTISEPPQK